MNEPLTQEGYEVWDSIRRGARQLRVAGNGVVLGLDIHTLAAIHGALGYDPGALLHLFHYAERGVLQAAAQHGDNDQYAECLDPARGDRR